MSKVVFISGGGTGGHIYPGISIAREFEKRHPDFKIVFIGSEVGLEKRIVPREGFVLEMLPIGKLNHKGNWMEKLDHLWMWPLVCLKVIWLILKYRPRFIVGVGGYAAGPMCFLGAMMGVKMAIWEANAKPGITNRILAPFARRIFVAFKESQSFFSNKKVEHVGLPIRPEIENSDGGTGSLLPSEDFKVLVFGGSQGARGINKIIKDSVLSEMPWLYKTQVIHQTGVLDYDEINKAYQGTVFNLHVHEYLFEMENYLNWADLVICRAGASTITELAALGKPAILVPLPTAADDHQKKNAEAVVAIGAALMIEQKNLTPLSLNEEILSLKNNPEKLAKMRENFRTFYLPQAASRIVDSLIALSGI